MTQYTKKHNDTAQDPLIIDLMHQYKSINEVISHFKRVHNIIINRAEIKKVIVDNNLNHLIKKRGVSVK